MAARARQIGLLGGTFDPVHRAHIALARAALEAFALDEVRLMPCAQQALKSQRPTPAADRCAMLRLALADQPGLTLDTRECYRSGKVYTYDTLRALQAAEPNACFWFILGMDSVCAFARWHRAAELAACCRFIAFDRPGVEPPERPFAPQLLAHRLRGPLSTLSGTAVREALCRGLLPEAALPPAVAAYLRAPQNRARLYAPEA